MNFDTNPQLLIRSVSSDSVVVTYSVNWENGDAISGTVRMPKGNGDMTVFAIEQAALKRMHSIVSTLLGPAEPA